MTSQGLVGLLVMLALPPAPAPATAPPPAPRECLAVTALGDVFAVPAGGAERHAESIPLEVDHYWCWSPDRPPQRSVQPQPAPDEAKHTIDLVPVRVDLGPKRKCPALTVVAAPAAMWSEVPESLLPRFAVAEACTAVIPRWAGESWRLRVLSRGLGTWWRELEPQHAAVTLRPEPAISIRLQVVDPEGQPTAASLEILLPARTGRPSELARFVTSDHWIEIPSLPEAPPVIAVFGSPGYVTRTYESAVHALPRRVPLQPSATVLGRFVDAKKKPVGGVKVVAEAWLDSQSKLLLRRTAESTEDGRWTLEGLPLGAAVVRASTEGFGSWRSSVELETLRFDFGSIVLEPGVRLALLVHDPEGAPVPDAVVTAGTQAQARTDPQGRAELAGLQPSARVRLTLDAEGFLATEAVVALGREEPQEVILRPAFEVTGRLLDASGAGIAEGRAEIVDGNASNTAELDGDGGFRLELQPGKAIELRLTSPRTRRLAVVVEPGLPGEVRDLGELRAAAGLTATGRVVETENEAPVPGARVWVPRPSARDPLSAWFHGDLLEALTDSDGTFHLSGLDRKAVVLTVEAPGFARGQFRLFPTEESEQVDLGDIVLTRGAEVEALIEERVSADAVARLDLAGHWREMDMLTAPVDDDRARFLHVPPGSATLTVMEGDRLVCEETVEIPAEPGPVEVACRRRSMTVTGTVQVADYPAGPGRLTWLPASQDLSATIMKTSSPLGLQQSYVVGGGRPQVDVAVAADGYFFTEDLRDGNWEVVWLPESGGSSEPKAVTLARQERLEIVLDFPGKIVAGHVTDESGEPVERARVRELRSGSTVWSGEDGSFRILGLAPGEYFLRADDRGNESETLRVLLDADQPAEGIQLVLSSEHEQEALEVVVVDAEERPIAGAFVFLDAGPKGLRVLTTNARGTAETRLDPPYPGQVRWAAWAEGRWFLGQPVGYEESLEHLQRVTFAEGGSLELRCESGTKQARLFSMTAWDVTSLMQRLGLPTVVRPDASLVVEGLPAGTYQVQVDDRKWQAQVRSAHHELVELD